MPAKLDAATIGIDVTEGRDLLGLCADDHLMYIELLVWSCGHDADGLVPHAMLGRVTRHPDPAAGVARLVAVGRLTEDAEGWRIAESDLRWQLTSDRKAVLRENGRVRQAGFVRHRDGDHGAWCPRTCTRRDAAGIQTNNQVIAQRNTGMRSVAKRSVANTTTRTARSTAGSAAPAVASRAGTGWTAERKARQAATLRATNERKRAEREAAEAAREQARLDADARRAQYQAEQARLDEEFEEFRVANPGRVGRDERRIGTRHTWVRDLHGTWTRKETLR